MKDSIVPLLRTNESNRLSHVSLTGMRPLVHPSLEDVTVEGILHALSDPVRVAIYADILSQGCASNCTAFATVRNNAIPKSTLSQHFKTLREAGLIRSERIGVEMQNTSRCQEVEQRFPGLLSAIVKAHTIQLAAEATRQKTTRKREKRPARAAVTG